MKKLLIATAFALAAAATSAAFAAPATPATPATPAASPAAKAVAGLPAECLERVRAHAERMKKELALTDAQVASIRNEMERYHGQLLTARADHRSAVAKLLTAEQNAQMESHHSDRRQKIMERCAGGMDDDMPRGKHQKG